MGGNEPFWSLNVRQLMQTGNLVRNLRFVRHFHVIQVDFHYVQDDDLRLQNVELSWEENREQIFLALSDR